MDQVTVVPAGSEYPEVAVVGQQFCAPYPLNLNVVRNLIQIPQGNFTVTDANGNLVFNVKGTFLTLRNRRILTDASGKPIVSLQQKIISLRSQWEVYRGDSSDSKDLLFTVKKSSILQLKTQLDVFLADNTKKDNCDFKIKGNWIGKACTICAGNSSTIIAQMYEKPSFSSILLGKDEFAVTVYPNVDYAFIVNVVLILEEINKTTKTVYIGATMQICQDNYCIVDHSLLNVIGKYRTSFVNKVYTCYGISWHRFRNSRNSER